MMNIPSRANTMTPLVATSYAAERKRPATTPVMPRITVAAIVFLNDRCSWRAESAGSRQCDDQYDAVIFIETTM